MHDLLIKSLAGQYEAGLCMMNQCVAACAPQHWEGKIANDTFRQIAYHTLFFTDLYLSPSESAFQKHDLIHQGGDERGEDLSPGLPLDKTIQYIAFCRQKSAQILAAETAQSLQAPSGFSWLPISRTELHIYNVRHLQHHTGQFSAYLRRVDPDLANIKALPWVRSGQTSH